MDKHSLDNYEKLVNDLIDDYFNSYNEYNEITINDFFTDLFYTFKTEEDMDIANEAEQQVRDIVFNGGIKHATQHKN